jgi:hypothetical protein
MLSRGVRARAVPSLQVGVHADRFVAVMARLIAELEALEAAW